MVGDHMGTPWCCIHFFFALFLFIHTRSYFPPPTPSPSFLFLCTPLHFHSITAHKPCTLVHTSPITHPRHTTHHSYHPSKAQGISSPPSFTTNNQPLNHYPSYQSLIPHSHQPVSFIPQSGHCHIYTRPYHTRHHQPHVMSMGGYFKRAAQISSH